MSIIPEDEDDDNEKMVPFIRAALNQAKGSAVGDEYGGKGPSREHEVDAAKGRLRVAIHSAYKSLCRSLDAYGAHFRGIDFLELKPLGDAASALEPLLRKHIVIDSHDEWQASGPVAWVLQLPKKDIWCLFVHNVPARYVFKNTTGNREDEERFKKVLASLRRIANDINNAAAEGRRGDGFRY